MSAVHEAASSPRAELDELVYAVSHDLRAPIRSIRGFAQILLEDHLDSLNEDGQDCVRRVSGAAARLSDMLDGLLAYSRLGRRAVRLGSLGLSEAAAPYAKAHSAHADVQPGITVQADPDLLGIVLDELFENAAKFAGPEARVKISLEGAEVLFCDQGPGISESLAGRVFTPFETGSKGGVGMGLSLVRRAMDMMGGSAAIRPMTGGACVVLRFGAPANS